MIHTASERRRQNLDRASMFVDLYALDVRSYPDAYKAEVRANPREAAKRLIMDLNPAEIARMLSDLIEERAAVLATRDA